MEFWIYMLIMDLLIPVVMIGFGHYFIKKPPREINLIFGYRTAMSMKNKDTWNFAHHYCGKLWRKLGWFMLPGSLVAMLFVFGRDVDSVGIFGGILCGVQLVVLLLSVFMTEAALKKIFDQNGNRKPF